MRLDRRAAGRLINNEQGWDWFVLDYPRVRRSVDERELTQALHLPCETDRQHPVWRRVESHGYGPVFWSFENQPGLACNGIHIISERGRLLTHGCIRFPHPILDTSPPSLSIFDPDGRLPLTLLRNELVDTASFERDVHRDIWCHRIAEIVARLLRLQSRPDDRSPTGVLDKSELWKDVAGLRAVGFQSAWCLCRRGIVPIDLEIIRATRARNILIGPVDVMEPLVRVAEQANAVLMWSDTFGSDNINIEEWGKDLLNGRYYGRNKTDALPFFRATAVKFIDLRNLREIEQAGAGVTVGSFVCSCSEFKTFQRDWMSRNQDRQGFRSSDVPWVVEVQIDPTETTGDPSVVASIWAELLERPIPVDVSELQALIRGTEGPLASALVRAGALDGR